MANSRPKRLYRSRNGVIAGVCGGLGDYFNVDPVWVRVLFLVLFFLGFGVISIVYLVFWMIVPKAPINNNSNNIEHKP
jgi:phage shock protein C